MEEKTSCVFVERFTIVLEHIIHTISMVDADLACFYVKKGGNKNNIQQTEGFALTLCFLLNAFNSRLLSR